MPDLKSLRTSEKFQNKIGALFTDKMFFSLDVPIEKYREKLEKISKQYPNYINISSKRFQNPYQTYLAVGSYPYFLEGHDAVLLPPGAKLEIKPKFTGDLRVEFAAVSLKGDAKIKVFHKQSMILENSIRGATEVEKSDSIFFKHFKRHLFPDRPIAGGEWQKQNFRLSLSEKDTLSFECSASQEGCFISEVSFWHQEIPSTQDRNVIFVLVDTLRFDALQSNHAQFMQKFQKKSLNFQYAIGAGNMTAISANSILACQKPAKISAIAFAYGVGKQDQEAFYEKKQYSFPTFLQNKGIKTAMIGNISILSEILGIGVSHGFDDQIAIEMEGYDTAHITKTAIHWLEENANRPFFLYLHYNGPHAPYRAPLKDIFATMTLSTLSSTRNFLLSLYQAEIRYMDRYLDTLAQAIENLGLSDKTTIIITSDHGDEHAIKDYINNEAGPHYVGSMFDHTGTLLYNDVLRVPLMISIPKTAPKNSDTLVTGLDLGPTVLELFGQSKAGWCDGISLFSEQDLASRNIVGAEGYDQRAIYYKQRFKYTKSYALSNKRLILPNGYLPDFASIFVGEQVFDLNADPNEENNLVRKDPALVNELRGVFNQYFNVKDELQLIVDSPDQKQVQILLSPTDQNKLISGPPLLADGELLKMEFSGTKRFVLAFRSAPTKPIKVRIGDEDIKIAYTGFRLPIHIEFDALPAEELDLEQLPLAKKASAFFVKTKGDPTRQSKITIGNPQFEEIFKQWGYLTTDK